MLTATNIADYFISLSNATENLISNLKLQKLVYYAQAWHIAVVKEPLFEEDFQAWVHGPVIPSLYFQYNSYKWHPIIRDDLNEDTLKQIGSNFSPETQEVLDNVVSEYFGMEAYALELSTHLEDPWLIARAGLPKDEPCTTVISKENIAAYYSQFLIDG
ncbi:DUF4065 domain-containing protein [Mucilaginibacter sp. HMF5004]|uniref:Panacea domain-containing protein n=1 Tax=Mucilaginibacter rivuli TaxID=2857527 RepID=UPI001C5DED2C|nr:type II toxin-antitoxin system antitoxin SocA domain-containing protein [Mucilaginibacter rivuli]MBW4888269.1 DUF4065 domain-containing protein [Mucilaginibacter rivuli]